MGLLRRLAKQREVSAGDYSGHDTLEVHGESHYQDNIRRVVSKLGRQMPAILKPEPNNPYDKNAVSVWLGGLLVGFLPKDIAPTYQPAIVSVMRQDGKPVAVMAEVFGGERGKESFGVWLRHDRAAFGLSPEPRASVKRSAHVLEGESEVQSEWRTGLPVDSLAAIKYLRVTLDKEKTPLQRHFIFNDLESHLYKCRDVFTSAATEFAETCERHHNEMQTIRPALVAEFGGLPMLPTYKQMAIMKQKTGDYGNAVAWIERGLAVYGEECLRQEAVEDLQKRLGKLRPKVSLPSVGSSGAPARPVDSPNQVEPE